MNDTEKFLKVAAIDYIGLDKSILKTLTPKVLKRVYKTFKKIQFW